MIIIIKVQDKKNAHYEPQSIGPSFTLGVCTSFIERVGTSERATRGVGGKTSGESQQDVLVRPPITVTPHRLPNQIDWIRFFIHTP
jgi:hypothetical protein